MALNLASRGCKVIIADIEDSEESKNKIINETGNSNVHYKYVNLASFESIRKLAKEINEQEEKLHLLINNAGSLFFSQSQTEDGCDYGMQVNHFGPFLLTHLLISKFHVYDFSLHLQYKYK